MKKIVQKMKRKWLLLTNKTKYMEKAGVNFVKGGYTYTGISFGEQSHG